HEGVMVVEVMGRYTGWIALNSGVSGGADVLLIPIDVLKVGDAIRTRERSGREFSIVVVAEGAIAHHGRQILREAKEVGREPRLGGIGEWLAVEIAAHTGKETRSLVLGHLQRGGQPTSFDRLLGTRFGAAAMR